MPKKILLPFYKTKTILDLIIDKINRIQIPVVVATTTNPQDDLIESFCMDRRIRYFRGSETDVLSRFIECAKANRITGIIRICSDNPFLDEESLRQLIEHVSQAQCDYMSYDVDGIPSIKTHFGFWSEYVTLPALEAVARFTNDKLYHEHVTNYIYTHPKLFSIRWLPVSPKIAERTDIRLTIDTNADFQNASRLYAEMRAKEYKMDGESVLSYLDQHPEYKESMIPLYKESNLLHRQFLLTILQCICIQTANRYDKTKHIWNYESNIIISYKHLHAKNTNIRSFS